MRLKTVLTLVLLSVVGIVFTSYFVGGYLTTQVTRPFSIVSDQQEQAEVEKQTDDALKATLSASGALPEGLDPKAQQAIVDAYKKSDPATVQKIRDKVVEAREASDPESELSLLKIGQTAFVDAELQEGWMPWIIRQVSILIGALSLVVFAYAGIDLIINGDNEEELKKASKMIIFGIVGIGLAAFSYTIVANVLALF